MREQHTLRIFFRPIGKFCDPRCPLFHNGGCGNWGSLIEEPQDEHSKVAWVRADKCLSEALPVK